MYCPECGKKITIKGKFCYFCGAKLSEVLTSATLVAPPAIPPSVPPKGGVDTPHHLVVQELESYGKYKILKKIEEGGMGAIFLGEHNLLKRKVAIKLIRSDYVNKQAFINRFLKEIQVIASLDHPNIVKVYDGGRLEDNFYMAMEYLEGSGLNEIIKEKGRLPFDRALSIVRQVALGLSIAADKRNIVHRDIKPSNIFVTRAGTAKILDFGLVKFLDEKTVVTQAQGIMGTPHYISPEQIKGSTVDKRTDIYSLGATFYQMITGNFLFGGENQLEIINKHLSMNPVPPKNWVKEIPDFISNMILKMVQKDPAKRYQSAGELIKAIDDFEKLCAKDTTYTKAGTIKKTEDKVSPKDTKEYNLTPDSSEQLFDIVKTIKNTLHRFEHEERFINRAMFVFKELSSNAFEHGCKNQLKPTVKINFTASPIYFKMVIEDNGPGFNAEKALAEQDSVYQNKPNEVSPRTPKKSRGGGLFGVKRAVAMLRFNPKGNKVSAVLNKEYMDTVSLSFIRRTLKPPSKPGVRQRGKAVPSGKDGASRATQKPIHTRTIALIKPPANLDSHTYQDTERVFKMLFQVHKIFRIIVDLSGVKYVSSAGASVFVGAIGAARDAGGDIILVKPSANVREVFDLLGLSGLYSFAKSKEEALAIFS